ncbi:MAG: hypothetical protein RKE49_15035 [Oceanicaulis sp.]
MKIKIIDAKKEEFFDVSAPVTVYAVALDKEINFCFQSNNHCSFPSFVSEDDAKIIDGRLSRYWVMRGPHPGAGPPIARRLMISFPELAHDAGFLEKLSDGDPTVSAIWRRYRELMDLEFSDPTLPMARHLEGDWYQCPRCDDGFEFDIRFQETLVCPTCGLHQRSDRT